MVRQRQMIGGVDMPVVTGVDPGARAAGIALIHRDDPVFLAQLRPSDPSTTAGAEGFDGLCRQKASSERSPPGAKIISGKPLPCTS